MIQTIITAIYLVGFFPALLFNLFIGWQEYPWYGFLIFGIGEAGFWASIWPIQAVVIALS